MRRIPSFSALEPTKPGSRGQRLHAMCVFALHRALPPIHWDGCLVTRTRVDDCPLRQNTHAQTTQYWVRARVGRPYVSRTHVTR